jgi:hypothetical protein
VLLAELSDLEAAWATRPAGTRTAPVAPLADLRRCANRLSVCLADETTRVHPLIREHLPIETGTLEVVCDEHATLQYLVRLLHERLAAVERREAGAPAAVDVVLKDLIELGRTHVRRFDGVIDPLLLRFEQSR